MKHSIFVVLILCSFHTSLIAQWNRTNGPSGGTVRDLHEAGGILYAATSDGVYKSTDDAISWTKANQGIGSDQFLMTLVSVGSQMFAGGQELPLNGNDGRIFTSTDEGQTWTELAFDFSSTVFELAYHKNRLFAATNGGGIYYSDNLGLDWTQVGGGTLSYLGNIGKLIDAGNSLIAMGFSSEELHKSDDNGATWTAINSFTVSGDEQLRDAIFEDNILYINISGKNIGSDPNGVYRSLDGGATWSTPLIGVIGDKLVKRGDTLVLFSGTTCRYTINEGTSWSTFTGPGSHTIHDVHLSSSGYLIAPNELALSKSTHVNAGWVPAASGFTASFIDIIYSSPSGLYAGGPSGGIHRTTDAGLNWSNILSTGMPNFVSNITEIGSTLYIAAAGTGGGIFESTDQGANWTKINNGMSNELMPFALAKSGFNLIAGVNNTLGVQVSDDGGNSWVSITDNFVGSYVTALGELNGAILANSTGNLMRSTDDGLTWQAIPGFSGNFNNIVTDYDKKAFLLPNSNSSRFFYSNDAGATWELIEVFDLGSFTAQAVIPYRNVMFLGTDLGVFYSLEEGSNFRMVSSEGLENLNIKSLRVHEGIMYAGSNGSGVFTQPATQLFQAEILDSLYAESNGDEWTNNTGWDAMNLSNRHGVTHEAIKGITTINLSDNNLNGELKLTYRAFLDSTTTIDLTGNELTAIPDMTTLASINSLSVENNRLHFDHIRPNLGITNFSYSPQKSLTPDSTINKEVGEGALLSAVVTDEGTSYQWFKDDVMIDGETTMNLTLSNLQTEDSGIYTCKVNNTFVPGLELVTGDYNITVLEVLSVDETSEFTIYPNPAANWITLKSASQILNQRLIVQMNDLTGRTVLSKSVEMNGSNSFSIEHLVKGIYVLRILEEQTERELSSLKIVKK